MLYEKLLPATIEVTPEDINPPFNKVALLLHGDGTNGAQNNTFLDFSYPGGYAVSFNGSGDYLSNTTANAIDFGTSDFTVEYWLYPSTTASLTSAGHIGNVSSGSTIGFGTNSSGVIYATTLAVGYTATASITIGTWQHIAWVRSGTTLNAYKNGVNIGTFTVGTNFTTVGFYIGSMGGVVNWVMANGLLSNMRVVKGTAVYTSNFVPSNLPLTAIPGTSLLTCQSATIVDNSPNNYTITVTGTPAAVSSKTITRTGNVAQGTFSPFSLAAGQWSNYFNGSDTYLEVADSASTQFGSGDFTIEAWVYRPANDTAATIVSKWGTLGWALVFYTTAGLTHVGLYGSEPSVVVSDPDTFPLNQWVHVAATRSGTTTRLFVNGVLKATATDSRNYNSTATVTIGSLYSTTFVWTGYVSNVRLIKGTALYTSTFTPPTSALTAVSGTSLLTCQSNRFIDNSSNNFTITPAGDTKVTAWSPFVPSTAYSAGTNGGSGYFDGNGDYLTTSGNSALAGDLTVECFVYLLSWPGGTWNMICGNTSVATDYFGLTTSNVELGIGGSSSYISYPYTFSLNTWYHIAVTRQGTTFKVYVNGVQISASGSSSSATSFLGPMYIGRYSGGLNFNGYISNFRVIAGTAVYTSNFTPPTAPLTAVSGTQLLLNCVNAGIYDNSGKNDIETVGDAKISTSVKKYGTGSMYFDGTGDYLKLPSSNILDLGTSNFTIEMWVYTGSPSSTAIILNRAPNSSTYRWLAIATISGSFKLYVTSNNSSWDLINGASFGSVGTNTWQHIAIVRNGSTFTGYVDGVGTSLGTSSSAIALSTDSLIVGGYTDNYYFNGYIDDLRITKGQALYTSNFIPPTQAFPNQ